jgi:translation initiation factor SUI1
MDSFLNFTPEATVIHGPRTGKIHIRPVQMGKKWVTLVEDLDDDLDLNRIARAMKKTLHCAADVVLDDKSQKEIIKLQGNHRDAVKDWLIINEVITEKEGKERLVLHGA